MGRSTKGKKGSIILILRGIGQAAGKLNVFQIGKFLEAALGYKPKTEINKDDSYLIHVKTEEQALKLTRLKKLDKGVKIKIERPPEKNTVKCIIQSRAITDMPDDELAENLRDQGIVKVRSIKPERRLKILHLSGTKVPQAIMIGPLRVKTLRYYPMPRVCRNCKQIGHITEQCKGGPHCGNCSGVHGTNKVCRRAPSCVNCGGGHQPLDKQCPLYIQEKAIIKIQEDGGMKPYRARRVYRSKASDYIPLPAEGTASDDSEASESEAEEENVASEGDDLEPAITGTSQSQQETDDDDEPRPKAKKGGSGGAKRKPKATPLKGAKRRSTRLQSTDVDDFLPADEVLRTRQQSEEE